jgi:hypothetical protein
MQDVLKHLPNPLVIALAPQRFIGAVKILLKGTGRTCVVIPRDFPELRDLAEALQRSWFEYTPVRPRTLVDKLRNLADPGGDSDAE